MPTGRDSRKFYSAYKEEYLKQLEKETRQKLNGLHLHGFKKFRLPYIIGIVERENIASVRVLEKLGMEYERETLFCGIKMDVYRLDATY